MQTPKANPATDADNQADIAAHAPPAEVVAQFTDATITIRPMRVRQVFPFLALARPLFAALTQPPASPPGAGLPPAPGAGAAQGDDSPAPSPLDQLATQMANADWMMDMLEQHGPQVIEALAIATDTPVETIRDLFVVELATLIKHVVVVNADFFKAQGLTLPQMGLGSGTSAAAMAVTAARNGRSGRGASRPS